MFVFYFCAMRKNRTGIFVLIIALSLLGLLWLQYYLISFSFNLKSEEFDNQVGELLSEAGREVEESFYCIDFFSEFNVSENEGLYLIKHRLENNTYIPTYNGYSPDTVRVNFWNPFIYDSLISYYDLKLSFPANIRMEMNVEYLLDSPNEKVDNLTINSYRKSLSENENFISTLDSVISRVLNSRGVTEGFQYILKSELTDSVFYKKPASLQLQLFTNPINTILFSDNYFFEPVLLQIHFPGKKINLIKELWLIILGSFVLISILIIMVIYFIRTLVQQQRLGEIKSDFISNMTHEFKTPVANINLALDTLERQKQITDGQINRIKGIIREENQRLQQNIDIILETSMFEKKAITLTFSDVNIHELLTGIIEPMEFELKEKRGEIKLNLQAGGIKLKADETHLSHAVYNLLDNAIKYTTANPIIEISTYNKSGYLIISINDNGIGIPVAFKDKIFDKFFRVGKGDQHDVKGFGLGLYYVKQVIDGHNGKITVKSKTDNGSRFDLWLPQ